MFRYSFIYESHNSEKQEKIMSGPIFFLRTDVPSEMPLRGREEDESEFYPDTYREGAAIRRPTSRPTPSKATGRGHES